MQGRCCARAVLCKGSAVQGRCCAWEVLCKGSAVHGRCCAREVLPKGRLFGLPRAPLMSCTLSPCGPTTPARLRLGRPYGLPHAPLLSCTLRSCWLLRPTTTQADVPRHLPVQADRGRQLDLLCRPPHNPRRELHQQLARGTHTHTGNTRRRHVYGWYTRTHIHTHIGSTRMRYIHGWYTPGVHTGSTRMRYIHGCYTPGLHTGSTCRLYTLVVHTGIGSARACRAFAASLARLPQL